MKFGELVKNLRITKRLTLRQFCTEVRMDPSNWSKIERGINPPPGDEDSLTALAEFFKLRGDDRQQFFDLAAVARRELPADIAADEALLEKLPAFFRAIRGRELEGDRLKQFVEEVRKLQTPDRRQE